MMRRYQFSVLIACLAVFTVPLLAQDEPPDMPMRGPAAERIEKLKRVRLMEVMRLSEETSIRFFTRYNTYQDELREFQRRRQNALKSVEELRDSNASDAEIEKGIQHVRSLDSTFLELRDKHWNDVRDILTTKQFASYVVFEHNFQRYLRELMRDMQRGRQGRMMPRGR